MGRTLDEMIATLTAEQQAEVARRAEALITEELSLRELRKALNLTQVDVAHRLNKGQEVVSRIEQRHDLLLSTLQGYVESLGGELELVCRFKDRAPVRVKTASSRQNRRSASLRGEGGATRRALRREGEGGRDS